MTVADITRKAGPYTGNGSATEFAFPFKVFQASDLVVARTSTDGEVTLTLNTDYTVTLNSDQDNNPGGKVTLTSALADGLVLAIISAVDFSQLAIFTNKGGFYPETLNECYDKLTILCQQLKEELSRAVTVDATDTMTPAELKQKLLEAATTALQEAQKQAEAAKASAAEAKKSEEKTAAYAEAATVISPIANEIKTVAGVADGVTVVSKNIDVLKVVSANSSTIVTVGENITAVQQAAQLLPHVDDIGAIKGHLDEVHKVGQDLLGVNSADFDCGEIGDDLDSITTVVDGYIKKVAEHIDDCVHPVGESLEAVELVAENLVPINQVAEVMTTDYEKIFNEGVS